MMRDFGVEDPMWNSSGMAFSLDNFEHVSLDYEDGTWGGAERTLGDDLRSFYVVQEEVERDGDNLHTFYDVEEEEYKRDVDLFSSQKIKGREGGDGRGYEKLGETDEEMSVMSSRKRSSGTVSTEDTASATPPQRRKLMEVTSKSPPQKRKQAHKEHSRRYRENVGAKFKELQDLVLDLADGDSFKSQSKSKVLQVSIRLMKEFKKQVSTLDLEIAMSSRKNLLNWVNKVVSESSCLYDALCPFMNVICAKRSWKYAEVWMQAEVDEKGPILRLRGALVNPSEGGSAALIQRFKEVSSKFTFKPGVGLIGRVYSSMRAETIEDLTDPETFVRAQVATRYNVNVGFAVPIAVSARCEAVVTFFDTEKRGSVVESVNLANCIANYLGIAYGAKIAKVADMKKEQEGGQKRMVQAGKNKTKTSTGSSD